ncbi:MAG: undecaprenyl-diphosphate phosphatase [Candidatus Thorarchaeota archaeon]|jgi:undecaprenyl-diphosphatase
MELWQAIVAFIQGLVEWLPISSEGQTVLFVYNFGNIPPEGLISLVAWLHLGTTLAVIARYPKTIWEILTLKDKTLMKLLLIATMSTAISAVPLYFLLRSSLSVLHGEFLNVFVGVLLLITASILYIPTRRSLGHKIETFEPNERIACVTGLIQGFSVLPGLSRSGVTISSLLMQKVDKETAMRFSFFMSIPAVLGIFVLEMLLGTITPPGFAILDLLIMELIVFVVGLLSMEMLLRISKSVSFWKLCLIIGVIAILFGIPGVFILI